MRKQFFSIKKMALLMSLLTVCHSSFADISKVKDGCKIKSHEMGVLYQQKSAEMAAIQLQTYALAALRLKQLNKPSKKPLAIVADIDETIIDNTALLVRDIKNCHDFTEWDTWDDWERYGNPTLIPGALSFFRGADDAGIKIYYVSDRFQKNKTSTLETLRVLGLPQVSDQSVLLNYASKEERRQLISKHANIIMLLGDSLSDFSADFSSKKMVVEQQQQVIKDKHHFGMDWIIFPNAAYGSWHKASSTEWKK